MEQKLNAKGKTLSCLCAKFEMHGNVCLSCSPPSQFSIGQVQDTKLMDFCLAISGVRNLRSLTTLPTKE